MNPENTAAEALLFMTNVQHAAHASSADARGERKLHQHTGSMLSLPPTTVEDGPASVSKNLKRTADTTTGELEEKEKKKRKTKVHYVEPSFPVPPRFVQVLKMPKTHVDHSYRDFSSVPPEPGCEAVVDIHEMTFAQKLHHMVSCPQYAEAIRWAPHGRAFCILVPKHLEQLQILRRYFGHSRYSTFLSQLRNHGLKALAKHQGHYYHEFMLRGLPHLCKYMPEFKEGRKILPDPDNEPDFDAISALWPVPAVHSSRDTSGGDSSNRSKDMARIAALAGFLPSSTAMNSAFSCGAVNQTPSSIAQALASLAGSNHAPPEQHLPWARTSANNELASFLEACRAPNSNMTTPRSSLLGDWGATEYETPCVASESNIASLIRSHMGRAAASTIKKPPSAACESDIAALIRARMMTSSLSNSNSASSNHLDIYSSILRSTTAERNASIMPPPVATTESQVESLIQAHFDRAASLNNMGDTTGSLRSLLVRQQQTVPFSRLSTATLEALLQQANNSATARSSSKATQF